MKMTFQPKKRSRAKVHGFRARMSTAEIYGQRKFIPRAERGSAKTGKTSESVLCT